MKLIWQSKLVLLLVLPFAGASVVLQAHWWAVNVTPVAVWTLGLSVLLGLVVLKLGAATPGGAFAGTAITASLMFATATLTPSDAFPYAPWHTALMPVLAVFVLTAIATQLGREKKVRLGTAERRQGRSAAQVAANLGVAALACDGVAQSWLAGNRWFSHVAPALLLAVGLAALAEAAADTVSSEIGQVLGGRPRMITTLCRVEAGEPGWHTGRDGRGGNCRGGWSLGAGRRLGDVLDQLRGRRLRLVLRQPAGSDTGTARLAEQRCGQLFVHGQCGGLRAGSDGVNGAFRRGVVGRLPQYRALSVL
jgi:uncharacterized membrane protein